MNGSVKRVREYSDSDDGNDSDSLAKKMLTYIHLKIRGHNTYFFCFSGYASFYCIY